MFCPYVRVLPLLTFTNITYTSKEDGNRSRKKKHEIRKIEYTDDVTGPPTVRVERVSYPFSDNSLSSLIVVSFVSILRRTSIERKFFRITFGTIEGQHTRS